MGNWITPGQPYEVEVEGKSVRIKALTKGERSDVMDKIANRTDDIKANDIAYQLVLDSVVSIEGFDGDVKKVLEVQSANVLGQIYQIIIGNGTLSDTERKNLPSLSDTTSSSPARDVQDAEQADVST